MLCTSFAKQKADNREAMLTIISTIHFLAPLRGSYVSSDGCEMNSNFLQLLHLLKEDVPVLNTWLQKLQDRFTSPSIQNELLEIMANMILRKVTRSLSGNLFSIMVDETSDISNTEQLVFCLRYVDEDLTTHEEFIGLHSMDSTTAESITRVIQDILLRLLLQMSSCRGQCYDGASSMAVCRSGVATTLQQQEPRALYTHCYGHTLNLAVQDSVKKQCYSSRCFGHCGGNDKVNKKISKMWSKNFKMSFQLILRGYVYFAQLFGLFEQHKKDGLSEWYISWKQHSVYGDHPSIQQSSQAAHYYIFLLSLCFLPL